MAHDIDITRGTPAMAYIKQTPWHGLGEKLQEDASIDEWQRAAGLDWTAVKAPVRYKVEGWDDLGIDAEEEVPSRFVLYRNDTAKPLSIVSDRYQPVQPSDVMSFFRTVCEELGDFQMETAGALSDGKKIWGLASANDAFTLGDNDEVRRYLLLATSYDQSLPTLIQQTSVRVVCANTLGMATEGQDAQQVRISHLKRFNIDEVALQMSFREEWASFGERLASLSNRAVKDAEAMEYFRDLFDGWGDADILDKMRREKRLERRSAELFDIYRGAPGQRLPSADRTAWGLVNAVTYYTDHASRARSQEARLDSAWFGDQARFKQRAVDKALALV